MVPQLFAATGAFKFTDPDELPFDDMDSPKLPDRGAHLLAIHSKNYPTPKIGVLLPERHLGRDYKYITCLRAGLVDKADICPPRRRRMVPILRIDYSDRQVELSRRPGFDAIDYRRLRRSAQEDADSAISRAHSRHQATILRRRDERPVLGNFQGCPITSTTGQGPAFDPSWKDRCRIEEVFRSFMAKSLLRDYHRTATDSEPSNNLRRLLDASTIVAASQALRTTISTRDNGMEAGHQPQ